MSDDTPDTDNVIALKPGAAQSERIYERTVINDGRRYNPTGCHHKGPFVFDKKLGSVECGDCGANLNPMYVLELIAAHETYWNMRHKELTKYLGEINKEIEERTRTKCTHCGNMTAIRFKKDIPRTWFPMPY